ncbi:MAG TPA: GntR family transcriptional regulator, partial [Bacillota bacterium]|nr:GntR family transcriptional regulator [Bacillota bacterium]
MTKRIVSTEKFLALKNSLDREDPRPLYHQLERGLRQMIEQGNIESGDRLPNDVELSNILGISHL